MRILDLLQPKFWGPLRLWGRHIPPSWEKQLRRGKDCLTKDSDLTIGMQRMLEFQGQLLLVSSGNHKDQKYTMAHSSVNEKGNSQHLDMKNEI